MKYENPRWLHTLSMNATLYTLIYAAHKCELQNFWREADSLWL